MDESKRSSAGATRSGGRRAASTRGSGTGGAETAGDIGASTAMSSTAIGTSDSGWQLPASGRTGRGTDEQIGSSAPAGARVMGRIKETATKQLSTQKDRATEGLGNMVQAVRQSTQQLRDGQHDTMAKYIEQAADQIEGFSNRLKQKDVGELLNDAQRLARRQPALFIGSAFALGLLGARFLKSSGERQQYGQEYGGAAGYSYDTESATGGYSGTTSGGVIVDAGDYPGSERF